MYVIQKGTMKTYIVRFRQFSCANSTHPLKYNYVSSLRDKVIIINPRRACARVIVVVLSVWVCVCLSVC